MSLFKIIFPVLDTNLVRNPSVETNTSGWIADNDATLTRTASKSRRGVYSLQVTPSGVDNSGAHINITLEAGTLYYASIDVNGYNGDPYRVYLSDGGANSSSVLSFTGDSEWHRYEVTYTVPSGGTYGLYVQRTTGGSLQPFYLDGAMVGLYHETYIDGDQPGCSWNGVFHSSTSTRSVEYRGGGEIKDFYDDYTVRVERMNGLGMTQQSNIMLDYGLLDGALYQRTKAQPRTIGLACRIAATGLSQLHNLRDEFARVLDPNITTIQQLARLRYTGAGIEKDIYVAYEGGLEFSEQAGWGEVFPLRFTAYDPYFYEDGDSAAQLGIQLSVPSGNLILMRTASGIWNNLAGGVTGASAEVYAIVYDPLNKVYYVGGSFSGAGGVSNTAGIAKYDPVTNTWSALGTGATGAVFTIVVDTNGDVYTGGNFTAMGGVANTSRVAKWNGSAWSALSTGVNNTVYALAFDTSHNLWIAGDFTTAGGDSRVRITSWNGSAFAAYGTGLSDTGRALALGPDGYMYVGGDFATANGVTVNDVAYWNGTTFVALSTGLTLLGVAGSVLGLAWSKDGALYVCGIFDTAGGVSCSNIARWNGFSFTPLGTGVDNIAYALWVAPDNTLYVGGVFDVAGGYTLSDHAARWNGSIWYPIDVDLNGTNNIYAITGRDDGSLLIGWGMTTGTASVSAITSANNRGKAAAYPKVIINGPTSGTAKLYSLINVTTGDTIVFSSSLVVNAGEQLILDLTPGNKSFTSNFQGNVLGYIVPGSNINWRLKPGTNLVGFFATGTGTTAFLLWKNKFPSADGQLGSQ